jgi:hypothetical protein
MRGDIASIMGGATRDVQLDVLNREVYVGTADISVSTTPMTALYVYDLPGEMFDSDNSLFHRTDYFKYIVIEELEVTLQSSGTSLQSCVVFLSWVPFGNFDGSYSIAGQSLSCYPRAEVAIGGGRASLTVKPVTLGVSLPTSGWSAAERSLGHFVLWIPAPFVVLQRETVLTAQVKVYARIKKYSMQGPTLSTTADPFSVMSDDPLVDSTTVAQAQSGEQVFPDTTVGDISKQETRESEQRDVRPFMFAECLDLDVLLKRRIPFARSRRDNGGSTTAIARRINAFYPGGPVHFNHKPDFVAWFAQVYCCFRGGLGYSFRIASLNTDPEICMEAILSCQMPEDGSVTTGQDGTWTDVADDTDVINFMRTQIVSGAVWQVPFNADSKNIGMEVVCPPYSNRMCMHTFHWLPGDTVADQHAYGWGVMRPVLTIVGTKEYTGTALWTLHAPDVVVSRWAAEGFQYSFIRAPNPYHIGLDAWTALGTVYDTPYNKQYT